MKYAHLRTYDLGAVPSDRAWRQVCKRTLDFLMESSPNVSIDEDSAFIVWSVCALVAVGTKLPTEVSCFGKEGFPRKAGTAHKGRNLVGASVVEFVNKLIPLIGSVGPIRLPDEVAARSILAISAAMKGPILFSDAAVGRGKANRRVLTPTELGREKLRFSGVLRQSEFREHDAYLLSQLTENAGRQS
jgi:hypothetical protein